MTKRIFRSVFLTAFAVMLACIALIVGALYSYFSARQEAQLATEARLAAAGVQNISLSNFDAVCRVAAREGYIQEADIARLLAFRDDPSDESWIGGAK